MGTLSTLYLFCLLHTDFASRNSLNVKFHCLEKAHPRKNDDFTHNWEEARIWKEIWEVLSSSRSDKKADGTTGRNIRQRRTPSGVLFTNDVKRQKKGCDHSHQLTGIRLLIVFSWTWGFSSDFEAAAFWFVKFTLKCIWSILQGIVLTSISQRENDRELWCHIYEILKKKMNKQN